MGQITIQRGAAGAAGGAAITAYDEGGSLTAALASLDFVGAGVVATAVGNAVTVTISGGGGTGVAWVTKTTTYTAVSGDHILANTTGGSFTITLPATPSANDFVVIKSGFFTSNTKVLTIARNGSNIMNLAENMTIQQANVQVTLVYNATTGWTM